MLRSTTRNRLPAVLGGLVFVLGLSACEGPINNPDGIVVLPDGTTRINARVARNAQLASTTHKDDLPEYTGAPGPDGRWPAYSGTTGRTIYRDADSLLVGSEGPGAETR